MRYKINKKGEATCSICGSIYPASYIEVDHLQELRHGGLDEDDNVRPLCKACHYAKTHAPGPTLGLRHRDQTNN